jgi:cell division transport system permease protein
MTMIGDEMAARGRTWRAGRGAARLHVLSIFSLAVAFVCLASALLVVTNIAAVRDRWSRAGRATIYLRDGASDAEVTALTSALEGTPGVKKVRHVTSLEARREVIADEQDKALAQLPASAFPASLEVGFDDEIADEELAAMALKLRALPAIESVETYQRWTERLSSLLGGGVTASACLAVIVLCAVVSVIGSTMRLLLHRRRIEVEVLKLVGATDGFVRRPFVVEGATQGAAGAAAALLMLGVLFLIVRGRFDQELSVLLGVTPSFLPWPIALGMVALGGTLGAATALVSLRRMVRV